METELIWLKLPSLWGPTTSLKNEKTGQLQINNLEFSVCQSLSSHIHGKQFFSRKVYVTSVVEKTPEKEATDVEQGESSTSDTSADESEIDEPNTVTKAPCTKLLSDMSIPSNKRPAKESPEVSSEKSKRDKKKKKKAGNDNSEHAALRSSSRQNKNRK